MKPNQTKPEPLFSLWVGGAEVNDYPLTKQQAENLQRLYEQDGYTDAVIEQLETH